VCLRSEFQDSYAKFTNERHLFTAGIADFQYDTLMALATCKDMERWYEKAHQDIERIDYISVVQKGRDVEENDIQVIRDKNIDQIRKAVEYYVKMAQEPKDFVNLHYIVKQHAEQDSMWTIEIKKVMNMET